MNLDTIISKHLQPGSFTVIGNDVRVVHPDNVKFLKNKLKKDGLPQTASCLFQRETDIHGRAINTTA